MSGQPDQQAEYVAVIHVLWSEIPFAKEDVVLSRLREFGLVGVLNQALAAHPTAALNDGPAAGGSMGE